MHKYRPNVYVQFQNHLIIPIKYILYFITLDLLLSCNGDYKNPKVLYKYLKPDRDLITIKTQNDSLSFMLQENVYNDIKSFNTFTADNREYISLYDRRSESINIYEISTQKLVKTIVLTKIFDRNKLYKTSTYCKNFDTVLVITRSKLYLLDKTGEVKKIISFLKKPQFAWGYFDNTNLPNFSGEKLYIGVRMLAKESSLKDVKKWRTIYELDLNSRKVSLLYSLPDFYHKKYYGKHFLQQSYCYNEKNNFVFSFPTDSNIYETNLKNLNNAYYAGSKNNGPIFKGASQYAVLKDKKNEYFFLTESYDAIYFDRTNKRYLRIVRNALSNQNYHSNNRQKKQSVIVMNNDFKIIGESTIDNTIDMKELFITREGNLYARIIKDDEYAIHFIKISYATKSISSQL